MPAILGARAQFLFQTAVNDVMFKDADVTDHTTSEVDVTDPTGTSDAHSLLPLKNN